MALSKTSLKNRIITELQNQGFTTTGTHAKSDELATALANAIVDEIKANAIATVTSGSSTGNWPIQ